MPNKHAATTPVTPRSVVADLALAVMLDHDALLVFGSMSETPPATARLALVDQPQLSGFWHAWSWSVESSSGRPALWYFIALIRADDILRYLASPIVLHPDDGAAPLALPATRRIELDLAALVQPLSASGAHLASVFDFLHHTLAKTAVETSARTQRFLNSCLRAISIHDGFIEILGQTNGGLLFQGWSVHLQPGPIDLGLQGQSLVMLDAAVGTFDRPDLLASAHGVVSFIKGAKTTELSAINNVYFKASGDYYRLDVVTKRIILTDTDAVSHLNDMLAKVSGPPECLRAFKRVCRPRFPGHETFSALTLPARVAQDLFVIADGSGLFVTGWLLDPCRRATMVLVKSTRNFYARIDQYWARLPRPDVTDGFAGNAAFAKFLRPWDNRHGFMAFVPRSQSADPDEVFYLEVVFDDESCAFLPFKPSVGETDTWMKTILGSVNISDPAIERIVARHLGPVTDALTAMTVSSAPVSVETCGPMPDSIGVSVIIPLCSGWSDFDVNLARFAGDPDFARAEFIVAAPRASGEQIAGPLRRYGQFHRLGLRLVLFDAPLDPFAAMDVGARQAASDLLLFLAPSVLPTTNGWLSKLIAALASAGPAAAISPTLLYEDDLIRYAGAADRTESATALALPSNQPRFAGYGRQWLFTEKPSEATLATTECCLIPKSLFLAAGGFGQTYMDAGLRNHDFALRVRAAGGHVYWQPGVTLYAVDANSTEPTEYWMQICGLVDRWGFARKWSKTAMPAAIPAGSLQ